MNFALIGSAGFVAPRHLKAIKSTGNNLLASIDPNDSVGILDKYFPKARFFTEIERFDRHLEKLKRISEEERVHYVSICSPNYLHDAHCRLALRVGAHAICEKPLTINPWNLDALSKLEDEYEKKIFVVLQLRLHKKLLELKKQIELVTNRYKVELTYVTPRGYWYDASWKGDIEKSGGVLMNIGIHLFDMLIWLFGNVEKCSNNFMEPRKASGVVELEKASVSWRLSVDAKDLPDQSVLKPYRSITIDGEEIDFTNGFEDLHTETYISILNGRGFGIEHIKPATELIHKIRTMS
jgi:UDP-N-acetyl-2-amino-2-deoxyglucuronate dehydrogenase